MSAGPEQTQTQAYAAARRAVARRLHPDLGGDPQEYISAMARLERQYAIPGTDGAGCADTGVHIVARRPIRSMVRTRARKAVVSIRGVLPRGWPGARRYGRL